jgi:hypothetical protein
MDSRSKYDLVVQRAARAFIQGILSEDPDEARDHFVQSEKGLLQALRLHGALVEVDDQEFLRRTVVQQVGNEILDEARKQLFELFPRCDPELRIDLADAFNGLQRKFCELALPVLH